MIITVIDWVPLRNSFWGWDFCVLDNNPLGMLSETPIRSEGTRKVGPGRGRSWAFVTLYRQAIECALPRGWCDLAEAAPFSWEQCLMNSTVSYLQVALEQLGKWVLKSLSWWEKLSGTLQNLQQYALCHSDPLTFSIKLTLSGTTLFYSWGNLQNGGQHD